MKLTAIRDITLEDIYWRLKAGKPKKRLTVFELRADLNKHIQNPVFFLSTGRSGTKWFSDLLLHNKKLFVLHSPVPSLAIQSKLAYELYKKDKLNSDYFDLLKEIFLTGREQHLRYSCKTNKRYIETNNYITFFAPLLIDLFPDAKFIHLYRHPGEFVRSAIRRNYYTVSNTENIKRIIPLDHPEKEHWENFSQLEKTAWLWNETNLFIEQFKINNPGRVFDFNFNELTKQNISTVLQFLDININPKIIVQSLNKKSNIQKQGQFPKYIDWNDNQKRMLHKFCNTLAKNYGYQL